LLSSEVDKYSTKITAQLSILESQGKDKEIITVLERYLAFMKHQHGVPVDGKPYWKRSNSDRVDNLVLVDIQFRLSQKYDLVDDPDAVLLHALAARQMLEHRDRSDYSTLHRLLQCERKITAAYNVKGQHDVAVTHSEQCLMFSRLMTGEHRISFEYLALGLCAIVRRLQSRLPEAIELAEEAYILISGAFGPVHPDVQNAASTLIQLLIANGDYSRADDYARMNYENLTDSHNGIDQDTKQVADVMTRMPPLLWQKRLKTW
jgi:hypothetical protein